jgi:hypothetical protein
MLSLCKCKPDLKPGAEHLLRAPPPNTHALSCFHYLLLIPWHPLVVLPVSTLTHTFLQVCLVPAAPVLPPKVTTPLEVRFRPLLLGSSEASLKLDSAELGLYEWKLKLTGAPTMPERPLTFSVPLGTREVQVRKGQGGGGGGGWGFPPEAGSHLQQCGSCWGMTHVEDICTCSQ